MTQVSPAIDCDEPIELVILVDEADRQIGTEEKLSAHRRGALHRAFSVMVFDDRGRLLLQQRHVGKYHSGGLWTNTCCGHPRPGEVVGDAAVRRLNEEMGFQCPLGFVGTFQYRAELEQGLIEHEFVHIFHGTYGGPIAAVREECDGYSWALPSEITSDVGTHPERYSAWFKKYVAAGWPLARR